MVQPLKLRLYNPTGPNRLALVTAQEVWGRQGWFQLVVARGTAKSLKNDPPVGPFAPEEFEARVDDLLTDLRALGFRRAGSEATIKQLQSFYPKVRAHAATRLGWARDREAVPELLRVAAIESLDLSSVVEALGRIGDPRGLAVCRAEAARMLLSRRRAGVEALRNLNDTQGLGEARTRAIARLPVDLQSVLDATDGDTVDEATLTAWDTAFKAVDAKAVGLALDTLYELDTPVTRAVVRRKLATVTVEAPHQWRYTKSILKRAMARGDHEVFAEVARRIDKAAMKRSGTFASIKSGLDGVTRRTQVFGPGTQRFMRRFLWRYLRTVARWRPADYPFAAAEVLSAWRPEDREKANAQSDGFGRAFAFNHVFRGGGDRYLCNPRSLRWSLRYYPRGKNPPASRQESFPELWDAQPTAYLRVLEKATLPEVLGWALDSLKARHPKVLDECSDEALLKLLSSALPSVSDFALAALDRRFDPKKPDLALLDRLCRDEREFVRMKAAVWLGQSAPVWTGDLVRVMAWLGLADGSLRAVVADSVVAQLASRDMWFRRELGELILAKLATPEPTDGAHLGYAQVAREALADELAGVLSLDEIRAMLDGGSPSAQTVAGALLARRPEAVEALGEPRVVAMAGHDVAAVREAARGLIQSALSRFADDPSIFFVLLESQWADARAFAFEMLRGPVDVGALGITGVLGLLDATLPDVRAFGREMALKHFDTLDTHDLLAKLIEHPAADVRRFAIDLAVGHLKPGFVALSRVEPVFRAALLDLRPSRPEKRAVMEFLLVRGMLDERQAEVASRLFSEVVRSKTKSDAERALDGLVKLRMKYPEVESLLVTRAPLAQEVGA